MGIGYPVLWGERKAGVLRFAVVAGMPFVLIPIAALTGGIGVWLALGYVTVLVVVLDRLNAHSPRNADPERRFPGAVLLLAGLALAHFALLGLSVWAVAGASPLSGVERIALAIIAGIVFGQISHPAAHELIHAPARPLRLLGRWVYTSLLVGHHASAHLLVHHVHVGTAADPSSAPLGESFYRFATRATAGSFRAGLAAENRRRRGRGLPLRTHPYMLYLGGAGLTLALALVIAGGAGIAALLGMAAYAQLQILLSDYVQHYGLRRGIRADGRPEPVGPQHSWNAPHAFSSAMMLNAPRHSDHHVNPVRGYPALQLDPQAMPVLPRSMPVMAVAALLPPLWRRMMDARCDMWRLRGSARPGNRTGEDAQTGPTVA